MKTTIAITLAFLLFFGYLIHRSIEASDACLAHGGTVTGKLVSGGDAMIIGHLVTTSPRLYSIYIKDVSGAQCVAIIDPEQYATIERGDTIKGNRP